MVRAVSETPKVLADVTAAWLGEVLGATIDEIDVHVIGEGEGFMGQLARVTITSSSPDVSASVIVKLPTADPGVSDSPGFPAAGVLPGIGTSMLGPSP